MENAGAFTRRSDRRNQYIPFLTLVITLAVLLTGCAAEPGVPTNIETDLPALQPGEGISPATTHIPSPSPSTTPTMTPGIDAEQLGEMAYRLGIVSQALPGTDGEVTLSGGHFEELYPDSAVGVAVDLVDQATGDLNADGVKDAIALLAINTGGSGTYMNLAAVTQGSDGPVHAATKFLGDRVRVESLVIEDGAIQVGMVAHAPEDPLCCPSQSIAREYALQDGMLVTPEQSQVLPLAEATIQALKAGDTAELASMVHPEAGLRFSPYSFVLPEHQVFSPKQLLNLMDDPRPYTWGTFDGSGEPILMTFADYFNRFVYSKDFAGAEQVGLDQRLGAGNTLDNSQEFYPGAVVVEYYLPGENPDYGGLDWQSLRLVFQQQGGAWYLTGIIHDEWTI